MDVKDMKKAPPPPGFAKTKTPSPIPASSATHPSAIIAPPPQNNTSPYVSMKVPESYMENSAISEEVLPSTPSPLTGTSIEEELVPLAFVSVPASDFTEERGEKENPIPEPQSTDIGTPFSTENIPIVPEEDIPATPHTAFEEPPLSQEEIPPPSLSTTKEEELDAPPLKESDFVSFDASNIFSPAKDNESFPEELAYSVNDTFITEQPEEYLPKSLLPHDEIETVQDIPSDEELANMFGEDIMVSFPTSMMKMAAIYVILQTVINDYTSKNGLEPVPHSITPADLDKGVTDEIIDIISSDISVYQQYFQNLSERFAPRKELMISENSDVSIGLSLRFMMDLFLKITADPEDPESINGIGKDLGLASPAGKSKMWELAEEIRRALEEKEEIINEIADPLRAKGFPVDARKLSYNYLKEYKRDPEFAKKMLVENPATFAPLQTEKIKGKFFGLIKPSAKDAIEINKSMGRFLKRFVN